MRKSMWTCAVSMVILFTIVGYQLSYGPTWDDEIDGYPQTSDFYKMVDIFKWFIIGVWVVSGIVVIVRVERGSR